MLLCVSLCQYKHSKGGDCMSNLALPNSNFVDLGEEEQLDIEGGGWPAVVGLFVLGAFVVGAVKGCADADQGK